MFRQFTKLSTHAVKRFTSTQPQQLSRSTPLTNSGRWITQTTAIQRSGIGAANKQFTPTFMRSMTANRQYPLASPFAVATVAATAKPLEVCPISKYSYDLYGYDGDYITKIRANEATIRQAIRDTIEDEAGEYDGHGSYAPLYVRLAWHSSGTYDQETKTGGSNGGCMRFQPEAGHGANAGLDIARNRLERVKQQFPYISYADLYTLAGVVAAEEMNDELQIPWRPGRSDYSEDKHYQVDRIRLPDGMQGADHIRDVFTKQMGFTDREIVALIGAHAVGLVHSDRSGFLTRPWTYSPTTLSNNFYTTLLEQQWTLVDGPNGTKHYKNPQDDLIMIPADYAFFTDPVFRQYVEEYAKDDTAWNKDFSSAFAKLLELGVPFYQQ